MLPMRAPEKVQEDVGDIIREQSTESQENGGVTVEEEATKTRGDAVPIDEEKTVEKLGVDRDPLTDWHKRERVIRFEESKKPTEPKMKKRLQGVDKHMSVKEVRRRGLLKG